MVFCISFSTHFCRGFFFIIFTICFFQFSPFHLLSIRPPEVLFAPLSLAVSRGFQMPAVGIFVIFPPFLYNVRFCRTCHVYNPNVAFLNVFQSQLRSSCCCCLSHIVFEFPHKLFTRLFNNCFFLPCCFVSHYTLFK